LDIPGQKSKGFSLLPICLHFKDLLKEAQTFFFFFWEVQRQTRSDKLLALPSQAHYSRRPAGVSHAHYSRFEPRTFCGPRVPEAAIPVSYCPPVLHRPFSITEKQVHCWWRTHQCIQILSFLSVHKTQAKLRDLNLVMQNAWYATFESCFKDWAIIKSMHGSHLIQNL